MNIYEENWVVGDHGRRWTSNQTCERERQRVVPLGCQVEPVFARPCYTRLFRASIENPKSSNRKKTWQNSEDAELESQETWLLLNSESLPGLKNLRDEAQLHHIGDTRIKTFCNINLKMVSHKL